MPCSSKKSDCCNSDGDKPKCKCFKCTCVEYNQFLENGYPIYTLTLTPKQYGSYSATAPVSSTTYSSFNMIESFSHPKTLLSLHSQSNCNTKPKCILKRKLYLQEIIRLVIHLNFRSVFYSSQDDGHSKLVVCFVLQSIKDKQALIDALSVEYNIQENQEVANSAVESMAQANVDENATEDTRLLIEEYHWKTVLSIEGMSCTSCTFTIVSNLKKVDGIDPETIAITLLPPRLTVKHSDNIKAMEIVDLVDGMGFTSSILKSENLLDLDEVETIKVRITGMTCTSCSLGIQSALLQLAGVESADINLITTVGVVSFKSKLIGVRDIIKFIEEMGYDVELYVESGEVYENREIYSRDTLWALILVVPTFLISMVFMMIFPDYYISHWLMQEVYPGLLIQDLLLFILATPVQFILGQKFYKNSWKTLIYLKTANMDTLITIGTSSAYFYSVYCLALNIYLGKVVQEQFFETGVFLIFFILVGKDLEEFAKRQTTNAVKALYALQPNEIELVELVNDVIVPKEVIKTELVQVGDILRVNPGKGIPCDGVVLYGTSYVDESMITGESQPVLKNVSDMVIGGTVNQDSMILVKVCKVGSDTVLARIISLMQDAQMHKAPIQDIADRISRVFVPFVLAVSLITLITWLLVLQYFEIDIPVGKSHFSFALEHAVAVLVIACPCALGLATPTAIMVGTGVAAKFGILIKGGGSALENASKIKSIVFDKTGTLTVGKPTVVDAVLTNKFVDLGEDVFWAVVDAVESSSDHPLAKAVTTYIKEYKIREKSNVLDLRVFDISETRGRGLSGKFIHSREDTIVIGNEAWMIENGLETDVHKAQIRAWTQTGRSIVMVGIVGRAKRDIAAILAISDQIRPESKGIIKKLQARGIDVWMITGDHQNTALNVSEVLNINRENVLSQVLPEEKYQKIKQIQTQTKAIVAMVGDGINDSVALAQSDLGVSIGSGSEIAIEAADVILIKSDLRDLLTMIDLSRVVLKRIKLNFFWALGYNALGIPVAAGVLNSYGYGLSAAVAGLAMAFSSVSVVFSSLLLNFYKPPKLQ